MNGYRLTVRVEVRPNEGGYPGPAPVVAIERAALVGRGLSEPLRDFDQAEALRAAVAQSLFDAADEAARQLRELADTLTPDRQDA